MKIGLIVECAPGGVEDAVCPKIVELLAAECKLKIDAPLIRTMVGKKSLILDCAATARGLLSDGCNRVVILWDDNPPWTQDKDFSKPRCWHFERAGIQERLEAAELPTDKAGLVCIEREFETILIHDTDLLGAVISPSEEHPAKIKKVTNPLAIQRPKKWLERQFRVHKSRYNEAVVAKKFAENLNNLNALKRCDIFRRLAEKILGQMPKGWDPYTYVPRGPKR